MRHVLHVPSEHSDSQDPVRRAVEAAVARGVARAAAAVASEAGGEIVPLLRPRPRVSASGDEVDGLLAVPSYQDKGRAVAVPVGPAARPQHPLVQAVNHTAEMVKRAQAMAGTIRPPSSPGIFGRMWGRGMAEDTARLLGPTPADLTEAETRLVKATSGEALKLANLLLNRNEQVARREASRYVEPNATVPGSPAVRLRQAAGEMAVIQKKILDRLRATGNAAAAAIPYAPQAGRPLDPDHFDDYMGGDYARSDPTITGDLLPQLNTLKRIYGPALPILLGRNLDYSKLAVSDPGAFAKNVGAVTSDVLTSIADLRKRLDDDSVWQLQPLLDATRKAMGVQPGTPAAAALDRYLAGQKTDATIRQMALAAIGIILALGATAVTFGAAGPEAVAAGAAIAADLSIAGAALSLLGAVESYEGYVFERAAAHSSLDPATALAREDPSIVWLAISVLGAVFDVKAAVLAVRNLGPLAKAAMAAKNLTAFEQAARAQARVLAAEGRLAGTEEQFVESLMKAARGRVGGSAAAALQHGAFVFRPNPNGTSRTLAEAVALAERNGIHIGEDVMLRIDPSLPAGEFARYGPGTALPPGGRVGWKDLTGVINPPKKGVIPTYWTHEPVEEADRFIRVALRPDVLTSDEAIIAVLAHEMHEINHLRNALQGGATMSGPIFNGLVNADTGSLHLEAWRVAIALIEKLRVP